MARKLSVFVYGATGYTGRLISYDLKRRGISFTIGGRNPKRLESFRSELGDSSIRIATPTHTVDNLRQAFAGHRIVINATGPFSLLGETVVKAALLEDAHYLDTTGEQDFMRLVKERYDNLAKEKGRVVINANSWYYSLGEAAAHYLKDTYPDLNTFSVAYCPKGTPTTASTQSLARTAGRIGYCYVDGKLQPIKFDRLVSFEIPGEDKRLSGFAIPGGEALHFASEEGVHTVKVYGLGDQMAKAFPVFKWWNRASRFCGPLLDRLSDRVIPWFVKMPPPEDVNETDFIVLAEGQNGATSKKSSLLLGARPYVVTGFLCGQASEWLLSGEFRRVGVISTAQAFGAQAVISALKDIGVSHKVVEQ